MASSVLEASESHPGAMNSKLQHCVEAVPRIADIPAAAWDACANPDPVVFNPFLAHGFLRALEDAGTVGGRSGWTPRHLVLKDGNQAIVACAPCYLKSHSQGEYVFDRSWAKAYERAGGRYYPKLQIAVPFTPVPGRRLLVRPGPGAEANEAMLAEVAVQLVERNNQSGLHWDMVVDLRQGGFVEIDGVTINQDGKFTREGFPGR